MKNPEYKAVRQAAFRSAIVLGLNLLLLAGCAMSPAARDELVKQRAQARWDALLAHDYAAAYSYASPGYRSSTSLADFEIGIRSRRLQYVSARYLDHSCEGASCGVKLELGYRVARPVAGLDEWKSTSVVEERWVEVDGNWWFVPKM